MRQIGILGGLLALSLVGAYLAWTAEEQDTSKAEQVVVYRTDAEDLAGIAWKSATLDVHVEKKTDGAGDYLWITATERVEKKPPRTIDPTPSGDEPVDSDEPTSDPGTDAGSGETPPADAPPEIEETTQTFKGNEAAETLWKDFAPLYALRELDPALAGEESPFGFDEEGVTLEIVRRSGTLSLAVGGETYGSKDRYVQLDTRIFLVDDKVIRPLEFAKTRLVDRLVQPLGESETDQVRVTSGARMVTLVHKNKEDKAQEFWANAETPTEKDTGAETWLGKIMRMRVQTYASESDVKGQLESLFTFTATGGDAAWTVEIFRETEGDAPRYFAKSSYTRSLVELTESLAAEAVADLETVLPEE